MWLGGPEPGSGISWSVCAAYRWAGLTVVIYETYHGGYGAITVSVGSGPDGFHSVVVSSGNSWGWDFRWKEASVSRVVEKLASEVPGGF